MKQNIEGNPLSDLLSAWLAKDTNVEKRVALQSLQYFTFKIKIDLIKNSLFQKKKKKGKLLRCTSK